MISSVQRRTKQVTLSSFLARKISKYLVLWWIRRNTVKSCKFKVQGTRGFISKYREIDIKIYNPQKWLLSGVLLSNIGFWCI